MKENLPCLYCQKRSDFCPPMKSESPHALITVLTFISMFRAVGCSEEKKGYPKPLSKGVCRGTEGNVKSEDLICRSLGQLRLSHEPLIYEIKTQQGCCPDHMRWGIWMSLINCKSRWMLLPSPLWSPSERICVLSNQFFSSNLSKFDLYWGLGTELNLVLIIKMIIFIELSMFALVGGVPSRFSHVCLWWLSQ